MSKNIFTRRHARGGVVDRRQRTATRSLARRQRLRERRRLRADMKRLGTTEVCTRGRDFGSWQLEEGLAQLPGLTVVDGTVGADRSDEGAARRRWGLRRACSWAGGLPTAPPLLRRRLRAGDVVTGLGGLGVARRGSRGSPVATVVRAVASQIWRWRRSGFR
ncbi:proline-rich receptor-like protein kinase PERK9 [Iris pallida]|uniref:Proline-rich receptor-like protein kinase PERK9 n=1 Tax=Iris pallida TaxID=29817 RepID=A0AAX6G3I7_IRIPA|nr:proline-rich receptor-like protein kinase PERK9 [Iris pallida]KAJ6824919.1 proline-rich receptor-like protein kinase PERK9 [Iris pallida]